MARSEGGWTRQTLSGREDVADVSSIRLAYLPLVRSYGAGTPDRRPLLPVSSRRLRLRVAGHPYQPD
jgi:hypothetical protein